jgi:predicted ArsR family transcriptional regulator
MAFDPDRPTPVDLDVVVAQASALGDRTRAAILSVVRERGSATVAELTAAFAMNHNTIRGHLGILRDAGLLIEEPVTGRGRGRPALSYRISPGALERWQGPGPHEELSLMLLDIVTDGATPRAAGRRAGARLAAESPVDRARAGAAGVGNGCDDPVDVLVAVTRRLGFEPRRMRAGDADLLVLARCPFAAGARMAPEVVCELHRGIAEGVCEATGATVRVVDLVIGSPSTGGCRLHVGTAAPPADH